MFGLNDDEMTEEEDDQQDPPQDGGLSEVLVNHGRGQRGFMRRSLRQKIAYVLSEVSVEPSLWLIMFTFGLFAVISQVKDTLSWNL